MKISSQIRLKLNPQMILRLLIILIFLFNISIISMSCYLCDLCDMLPKVRGSIELQLTEELTEPNNISHKPQDTVIIHPELLLIDHN